MNEKLRAEMLTYSSKRIMNTINQPDAFDPGVVEMARMIAEERGLLDPEHIARQETLKEINNIARKHAEAGNAENAILKMLIEKYPEADPKRIAEIVRYQFGIEQAMESSKSTGRVSLIIGIVIFGIIILRLALCAVQVQN